MKLKSICLATVGMVLLGVWAAGCGGPGGSASSGSSQPLVVGGGELPSLGGYIPPLDPEVPGLDENRLKVPFPKGWTSPPRTGQVLVWFKESKQHDYPQILVTVEEFESVMNVDASTVSEFVQALSAHLHKKNPNVKIPVSAICVGDRYGALYRRLARTKSQFTETELERLVIETVVDGRKYAFELRSYPGHAEKYAPYLYAVFSGTKFLKTSAGQAAAPSQEKPTPPETPSEEPTTKPEPSPEKGKPEPGPKEPPTKPEPPPEKPKAEAKPTPEVKEPPATKPAEEKPEPKSEPAEKPKKKKKSFDFDIVE